MIGGNITKGKQNNKYKYDNVANDAKIEGTNMDVRRLIRLNGPVNTIAKIQMTPIRNRAIRRVITFFNSLSGQNTRKYRSNAVASKLPN